MILLEIYLASTLISLIVAYISAGALVERAKREGIAPRKESLSNIELTYKALPLFIPIFNVFLTIIFVFCSDEMYSKVKLKREIDKTSDMLKSK